MELWKANATRIDIAPVRLKAWDRIPFKREMESCLETSLFMVLVLVH